MYACMHVCLYVVFTYVDICIYIYTHEQTDLHRHLERNAGRVEGLTVLDCLLSRVPIVGFRAVR